VNRIWPTVIPIGVEGKIIDARRHLGADLDDWLRHAYPKRNVVTHAVNLWEAYAASAFGLSSRISECNFSLPMSRCNSAKRKNGIRTMAPIAP
jgi:hypothetical protein